MKIHSPAGPKSINGREIDVERGAVTFDPWPFAEESLELDRDIPYARSDGDLADDGPYTLSLYGARTFAYLKDGSPVLAHQSAWDAAVERHNGGR